MSLEREDPTESKVFLASDLWSHYQSDLSGAEQHFTGARRLLTAPGVKRGGGI